MMDIVSPEYDEIMNIMDRVRKKEVTINNSIRKNVEKSDAHMKELEKCVLRENQLEEKYRVSQLKALDAKTKFVVDADKKYIREMEERYEAELNEKKKRKLLPSWISKIDQIIYLIRNNGHSNKLRWRSKVLASLKECISIIQEYKEIELNAFAEEDELCQNPNKSLYIELKKYICTWVIKQFSKYPLTINTLASWDVCTQLINLMACVKERFYDVECIWEQVISMIPTEEELNAALCHYKSILRDDYDDDEELAMWDQAFHQYNTVVLSVTETKHSDDLSIDTTPSACLPFPEESYHVNHWTARRAVIYQSEHSDASVRSTQVPAVTEGSVAATHAKRSHKDFLPKRSSPLTIIDDIESDRSIVSGVTGIESGLISGELGHVHKQLPIPEGSFSGSYVLEKGIEDDDNSSISSFNNNSKQETLTSSLVSNALRELHDKNLGKTVARANENAKQEMSLKPRLGGTPADPGKFRLWLDKEGEKRVSIKHPGVKFDCIPYTELKKAAAIGDFHLAWGIFRKYYDGPPEKKKMKKKVESVVQTVPNSPYSLFRKNGDSSFSPRSAKIQSELESPFSGFARLRSGTSAVTWEDSKSVDIHPILRDSSSASSVSSERPASPPPPSVASSEASLCPSVDLKTETFAVSAKHKSKAKWGMKVVVEKTPAEIISELCKSDNLSPSVLYEAKSGLAVMNRSLKETSVIGGSTMNESGILGSSSSVLIDLSESKPKFSVKKYNLVTTKLMKSTHSSGEMEKPKAKYVLEEYQGLSRFPPVTKRKTQLPTPGKLRVTVDVFKTLMFAFKNSPITDFRYALRVMDTLQEYIEADESKNSLDLDVSLYNTLISVCIRDSLWRRAIAVYEEMIGNGIVPNTQTFRVLIECCRHTLDHPAMVFETMCRVCNREDLRDGKFPLEFCYKAANAAASGFFSNEALRQAVYSSAHKHMMTCEDIEQYASHVDHTTVGMSDWHALSNIVNTSSQLTDSSNALRSSGAMSSVRAHSSQNRRKEPVFLVGNVTSNHSGNTRVVSTARDADSNNISMMSVCDDISLLSSVSDFRSAPNSQPASPINLENATTTGSVHSHYEDYLQHLSNNEAVLDYHQMKEISRNIASSELSSRFFVSQHVSSEDAVLNAQRAGKEKSKGHSGKRVQITGFESKLLRKMCSASMQKLMA